MVTTRLGIKRTVCIVVLTIIVLINSSTAILAHSPVFPDENSTLPSFCLMMPSATGHDSVPNYVEIPIGYGTTVVTGADPSKAIYEPFTPSWLYNISKFTTTASVDGTYYVAVYNPNSHNDHSNLSNSYAIVVGYLEGFTPLELIQIPYRLNEIYLWEGQKQFFIFLPMLLVVIIGGIIAYRRNKQGNHPKGISKLLATFGGLLFIGTAAGTFYQIVLAISHTIMTPEILVSLVLVGLSILLGVLALRYGLRSNSILNRGKRVTLIIIGLAALFVWSGFYIGPALLIVAALGKNSIVESKNTAA